MFKVVVSTIGLHHEKNDKHIELMHFSNEQI